MKLLIVTQAIDTEDPVLGFFAHWVEEFAKHYEQIEVICLKEGKHNLPVNVRVHSLGKENGAASRVVYSLRFLKLVWKLRNEYDAVFVHMNQEYILIAGWFWNLLGKNVYMWRNHYEGSWLTGIATAFCTKVFCTSKYSYTAKYKKTVLMPVGIDTTVFIPRENRVPNSILFLARMAPSKRPEVLIEALGILAKKGIDFTASLYGSPTKNDEKYYEQLKHRVVELNISSQVQFYAAIRNADTPTVYAAHEICVNVSPSGMYDKTIFESAASGCLSLTSNSNLQGTIDTKLLFEEVNAENLAGKMEVLLKESEGEKEILRTQLRKCVEELHSLTLLGNKLSRVIQLSEVILFQNGSIGDFLMSLHLSELVLKTGQFSRMTIVVPRNTVFLRELSKAYLDVSVLEVSSKHWQEVLKVFRGTKTILVHPTIGRIPLRLKLLVWILSRGKGSESIGFQDAGHLCSLYTHTLLYDTNKPYLDTIHDLARAAGAHQDSEPPYLSFNASGEALKDYSLEGKKYIVFHPGASNPRRMFTVEDATEFIQFVSEEFPNISIVLSGGPDEREFIEKIIRASGKENIIIVLGASAGDIATLVKYAKLFVGTDTGITHLACFLNTRVIEVAHNATMNWLAFYAPNTTVLYRLNGDTKSHTEQSYLEKKAKGVLRPFTTVSVKDVCAEVLVQLRETVGA